MCKRFASHEEVVSMWGSSGAEEEEERKTGIVGLEGKGLSAHSEIPSNPQCTTGHSAQLNYQHSLDFVLFTIRS